MKRNRLFFYVFLISIVGMTGTTQSTVQAEETSTILSAGINGTEPGWIRLGEEDFAQVNGNPDTWTWKDGVLQCSGQPVGVLRSAKIYTNFELIVEWQHQKFAGNSGVFVWVPIEALTVLKPGSLPGHGIEVQMLDHGYTEQYEKSSGKKAEWFTTNGDIFAVGQSLLKPFPPLSPDGSRSFPRKNRSKGFGEWNHYYVRCINGEVRLWVNGEEISGGNGAEPRTGHFCMESEGSPIQFRKILIRELP